MLFLLFSIGNSLSKQNQNDYDLLERATLYDSNLYEAYSKCNKESTACAIYEKLDTIKMIK